ncbi:MAG TPA: hypothetical protein PKG48_13495 [Bacteroidales bacterium]|nr:hypothetical protein [Bacteroidales bacterium]HPS63933.1 hypothetical protein [Bacteroidales bacterium]
MKTTLFEPGKYYHVFNQARNGDPLFGTEEDFRFFLKLYQAHICPIADTYAYCLLSDHLHFLIRIREEAEGRLYKPFALLFNGYAKGYSRHHETIAKVFKFKMKRKEIRNPRMLMEMIRYVNQDPCRHGAAEHPGIYRFSSFRATLSSSPTLLAKDQVREYFGTNGNLEENLLTRVDESIIRYCRLES